MKGSARHRLFKVKQGDFCRRITYNNLCIEQADQGDKQTDTHRYSPFQAERNNVKHRLPNISQRQDNKDETFHTDGSQGHLPGIPHLFYYCKSKKGIQPHARR